MSDNIYVRINDEPKIIVKINDTPNVICKFGEQGVTGIPMPGPTGPTGYSRY